MYVMGRARDSFGGWLLARRCSTPRLRCKTPDAPKTGCMATAVNGRTPHHIGRVSLQRATAEPKSRYRPHGPQGVVWGCLAARTFTCTPAAEAPETDHDRTPGRSPMSPPGATTLTHRSRRPESDHKPTHGRSPVWPPGATTLTHRSRRPESDHKPTHGRSPVWRADPRCSYERSLPSRTPRVAARLGWSFLITP
jgi:hypothetical protein